MSDKIKIESGIKIPLNKRRSFSYPFETIKVGQSFFVPHPNGSAGIAGSLTYAKLKFKIELTARTLVENGVKGVRVWRTA